jgi:hypothetical protein
MNGIHGLLAYAAAAGLAAVLVAAAAMAVGLTRSRLWLDRAILVQIAAGILAALAGVFVAATVRPPADPLHLLYGGVLVAAPGVARYAARRADAGRMGRALAIVAVVTLGVAVRAFMTGG